FLSFCISGSPAYLDLSSFPTRRSSDLLCRFIPHSIIATRLSCSYRYGPPRYSGQRPHAFVDRPKTLTPSIYPRLGASSQHKELHRSALQRIFSPTFRNGGLTRILHHPVYIYFIINSFVNQSMISLTKMIN